MKINLYKEYILLYKNFCFAPFSSFNCVFFDELNDGMGTFPVN